MSARIASTLAVVLSVALLPAAMGCFKSSTSQASSESSSKSSGSSSASSGSSSGPSRYVKDLRDYSQQFVLSGGEMSTFAPGVAKIAEKRGVTNWEQDQETYEGIGRGLKKAGVSGQRLEGLKRELGGTHPNGPKWIQKGFDSEKKD